MKSGNCGAPQHLHFYTLRLSTDKDKDKYRGKCKAVSRLNKSLGNEEEELSGL